MALKLQNSHGKMTMLPYQLISQYVNGEPEHLHIVSVTHLIFYIMVVTGVGVLEAGRVGEVVWLASASLLLMGCFGGLLVNGGLLV